jgi:hypothetical protein
VKNKSSDTADESEKFAARKDGNHLINVLKPEDNDCVRLVERL